MHNLTKKLLIFFSLLVLVPLFFITKSFFEIKSHYPHEVAISAIFQNEAPWLKEWVEYHKLLGVTHFRLYDNESTDNYQEVLAPYIREGLIEVINWPTVSVPGERQSFVTRTQLPAYKDALASLKGTAKWVALIDIDEFIVPHRAESLPAFLSDYESSGAIAVNWVCYGTSGVKNLGENDLLIEKLVMKANEDVPANRYEKCLIRPEGFFSLNTPHFPRMLPFWPVVWEDKSSHSHQVKRTPNSIQINHYIVRTEDYLFQLKIPKREAMENRKVLQDEVDSLFRLGNDVVDQDRYIFRFIPKLKAVMSM